MGSGGHLEISFFGSSDPTPPITTGSWSEVQPLFLYALSDSALFGTFFHLFFRVFESLSAISVPRASLLR